MSFARKQRFVKRPPIYRAFRPVESNGNQEQLSLTLDEFEAVRLADYLGMDHEEASKEMGISRSTFSRLIERARKKVSIFLMEGRPLYIEGGNIHFGNNLVRCNNCGTVFNSNFDEMNVRCPSCSSVNLTDLARDFGHGRCCRGFNRG